jgi:large subunit ribosomal protein L24
MSLARIRKGDTVVVISGKDKGKTGKVIGRIWPRDERVLIEGDQHRQAPHEAHVRDREGGIVERERPCTSPR